jgi:hypothetical protein
MPLSRINSASIANSAISAADIADGTITAAKIISVANTQITGNIVSSQITSVANTQLTGTISGSQISSNTLSNTVFQTGSVENYMNAAGLGFGMRNRIINGAMVIDQRATSLIDYGYATDRWSYNPAAASKATVAQSSTAPAGFNNSLLVTSSAATSVGATDVYIIEQKVEGFNVADLGFGTASASAVTISFWVRSSLTGTFGGALGNAGPDRSYPFTYTINAANTFEYKTVTIAGDTSGTWATTNGAAFRVCFSLGCGTSRSGTAGAWTGTSNIFSVTGATSVVGTSGATFYITGVQLEKGSTATSFDYRPFGTELALCQRYFYLIGFDETNAGLGSGFTTGTTAFVYGALPVTMRTRPTLSYLGTLSDISFTHTSVSAAANSLGSSGTGARSYVLQIGSATSTTTNAGIYARVSSNTAVTFSSEL